MKKRLAGLLFFFAVTLSAGARADDAANLNAVFVNLTKKMVPTVVNIHTSASRGPGLNGRGGFPENDLWRRFFEEFFGADPYGGGPNGPGGPGGRVQSMGSGFVIEAFDDGGGLILTNNHVIDDADDVKVKFTESLDERPTAAEVVGRDPELDVALLKVKVKRKLTAAPLGDSDKLEQGEWVIAVGNPFGHGHSVAKGIVSAKERTLPGSYSQYLQVDAPINPGNSGGPLANLSAEVVGISNAVLANAQGIGFAIPINLVKRVLPQLKTKGRVERGYIGVNIEDLRPSIARNFKADPNLRAPIVTNVIKGGPGDKGGIKPYDIITEIGGKPVRDSLELVNTVTVLPAGEKVKVKVLRQGKEATLTIIVGRRPSEQGEPGPAEPRPKKGQTKIRVDAGMELAALSDDLRRELGITEKFPGVVVIQTVFGGPADRAGLVRGDVILEVDRKIVKSPDEFYGIVRQKKSYLLRVRRQDEQGAESYAVVTLNLSDQAQGDEDEE